MQKFYTKFLAVIKEKICYIQWYKWRDFSFLMHYLQVNTPLPRQYK